MSPTKIEELQALSNTAMDFLPLYQTANPYQTAGWLSQPKEIRSTLLGTPIQSSDTAVSNLGSWTATLAFLGALINEPATVDRKPLQ